MAKDTPSSLDPSPSFSLPFPPPLPPSGTPLGETTLEVAEKVATDTAEELKRAEAAAVGELPGRRTVVHVTSC